MSEAAREFVQVFVKQGVLFQLAAESTKRRQLWPTP